MGIKWFRSRSIGVRCAGFVFVLAAGSFLSTPAQALSFYSPVYYPAGATPRGIVSADFDGDGVRDLAVVNPPTNTISILVGDGAGGFLAPVSIATGQFPSGIAVADFDQDGDPDLATADSLSNTASIFFGGAGASFAPRVAYGVAPGPKTIAIGPGYWDVAPGIVTTSANNQTTHYEGDGSGQLFWGTTGNGGPFARGVVALDFDHDSDEDLVVANADPSADPGQVTLLRCYYDQYDRVWYYTTNVMAAPAAPQAVTAYDLDGGSWADLIGVTAGPSGSVLSVWQGDGTTPYHSRVDIAVGPALTSVVHGDLDGDPLPDIAAAGPTGAVALFRNDAGSLVLDQLLDLGEPVAGVAIGDLDDDGYPDLAAVLPQSDRVVVFRGGAVAGIRDPSAPAHPILFAGPNPSRGPVTVTLRSPAAPSSLIEVLDVNGRRVRRLTPALAVSGESTATWDLLDDEGSAVAAGLYFITCREGSRHASARVTVIR